MQDIFDSHFHFDFLQEQWMQEAFVKALEKYKIDIFAQTVLPSDFRKLVNQMERPKILGLGYHPWWINASHMREEVEIFQEMVSQTPYIGEIGLDFSDRGQKKAPRDVQVTVFRDLLRILKSQSMNCPRPYLLSVHAVKSTDTILDILESLQISMRQVLPIFHWFSGTSQELSRIIRVGGYFSINPRMLQSKKGRAYIQQIPQDLLLLETDWPLSPVSTEDQWEILLKEYPYLLQQLVADISKLRDQAMEPIIEKNHRQLFFS